MLHEYRASSGTFRLSAAGCTTIVEAPIDWGTVEALPAPSERREASAVPPHERQVARVIPQWPGGRASLMLLNQLLQQEPGLPGPPPPSSYSLTSESVESGEWWDDDEEDDNDGGATGGAVGSVGGVGGGDGGGGIYTEGD